MMNSTDARTSDGGPPSAPAARQAPPHEAAPRHTLAPPADAPHTARRPEAAPAPLAAAAHARDSPTPLDDTVGLEAGLVDSARELAEAQEALARAAHDAAAATAAASAVTAATTASSATPSSDGLCAELGQAVHDRRRALAELRGLHGAEGDAGWAAAGDEEEG
eukprot:Rhum_TRINITY_DN15260_c0_g2::Rhum_TRINITY_DN15260_c0_g2_i1::g.146332::m.146332